MSYTLDRIQKQLRILRDKYDPREKAELFRSSGRNASFSLAEYLFSALFIFIFTPFFVHRLGTDRYGIWMLSNSIMGFIGVMEFGLGAATVKYVSAYLASKKIDGVVRVVRSTLTMYAFLGLFSAALVYILAPLLVNHVFNIRLEDTRIAIAAIQICGFGMAARFLDSVFLAILQGYQRYDLAAKIAIIVNIMTLFINIGLLLLGYNVIQILSSTIGIAIIGSMAKAFAAKRFLLPSLSFWPIFDRKSLKEIFSFGFYSWLQSIGGMLFSQVDRLLIVSLLNTNTLTYYTVCLQLAQQIHTVLSKALSFLFPLSSALREEGNIIKIRSIYFKVVNFTTIAGVGIGLPIFLFAHNILSFWMGVEFSNEASNILRALVFACTLLAMTIVPSYFLNGTGFVHLIALFAFISGFSTALLTFFMIPLMGVLGAALARNLNNLPICVILYMVIHHKVLNERRWYAGISDFVPAVCIFMLGAVVLKITKEPDLNIFLLLSLLAMMSLVGMLLASLICRYFNHQRVNLVERMEGQVP